MYIILHLIQVGTILNAKKIYEGTFMQFVRTDPRDHSRRKLWLFQNPIAISVKSWKVCTRDMVFQQKLLENADFIFKVTGRAMVRRASSDKWKEPWKSKLHGGHLSGLKQGPV